MHDDAALAARLKTVRKALKYTQSRVSEAIGSKLRSWQDYEKGSMTPGGQVFAGLSRLGVNTNWLFTGEGPMLMAELESKTPTDWNPELLRQVIEAVETALDVSGREMDPPDKAELILSIYDLYAESGVSPSTAKIIKLVKSTA